MNIPLSEKELLVTLGRLKEFVVLGFSSILNVSIVLKFVFRDLDLNVESIEACSIGGGDLKVIFIEDFSIGGELFLIELILEVVFKKSVTLVLLSNFSS